MRNARGDMGNEVSAGSIRGQQTKPGGQDMRGNQRRNVNH